MSDINLTEITPEDLENVNTGNDVDYDPTSRAEKFARAQQLKEAFNEGLVRLDENDEVLIPGDDEYEKAKAIKWDVDGYRTRVQPRSRTFLGWLRNLIPEITP
ncbi:hypothetical protein A2713_02450 [candidate division WWE3 bacterium RIFCSPHIGHO2_01_FULL_35_17]|uniref:Uncharacterized protein n=1 Tax=candidate division WWE3 bacterium RIFCSPHIGHO2_01_FULL_35_17 TaxID=1802614 RepID=A0A1F4UQT7_UNCKA|nr:MAG: hypothetical protein A2713_02450 [candidate division WWE3 bacterium RIFCSPHIGHO2_01_FULL_35_17]